MQKKMKRFISLILLVAFAMSFCAQASDASVLADKHFTYTKAQLIENSTTLFLDFSVKTNTYNNQLGVSLIMLHDLTAGTNTAYTGSFNSGTSYAARVIIPATKGHRYYATITFYADGSTLQVDTNTLTF